MRDLAGPHRALARPAHGAATPSRVSAAPTPQGHDVVRTRPGNAYGAPCPALGWGAGSSSRVRGTPAHVTHALGSEDPTQRSRSRCPCPKSASARRRPAQRAHMRGGTHTSELEDQRRPSPCPNDFHMRARVGGSAMAGDRPAACVELAAPSPCSLAVAKEGSERDARRCAQGRRRGGQGRRNEPTPGFRAQSGAQLGGAAARRTASGPEPPPRGRAEPAITGSWNGTAPDRTCACGAAGDSRRARRHASLTRCNHATGRARKA